MIYHSSRRRENSNVDAPTTLKDLAEVIECNAKLRAHMQELNVSVPDDIFQHK
jgi:hypothetical protein